MRIEGTGVTVNGKPRVKLALTVQPTVSCPFDVEKAMNAPLWAMSQIGHQIWVKYDPNDTSRVEIDQAKNDEMSAAAPAQPMPGAMPGGNPVVSTTFTTMIPVARR